MKPADRDELPGNDVERYRPSAEATESREDEEHKIFGLGIARADARQPSYGQGVVVSLLTAAAVLVLAVIAVGEGDHSDPPVLQRTDNLFWIIAAFVMILAVGGSQFAERNASRAAEAVGHPRPENAMATAWTVPFASAFAAIVLVATFHNQVMLVIGPAIALFGIAGALLSRDLLDDADEQSGRVASTIHTLVVDAVAFLAFSAIYLNKLDSWISAPLVGLIGGMLILESLERGGIGAPTRVFYAVIGGWALAQVTIALNWWPSSGWTGGAVLLTVFYVAAGLILVRAQKHEIRPRDLAEFGIAGAGALIVLAVLS